MGRARFIHAPGLRLAANPSHADRLFFLDRRSLLIPSSVYPLHRPRMLPSFARMRRLPYLPPRSSAGVAAAASSPTAMMVVLPVDGRQQHLQQRQQCRAITSLYNSGQSLTCPLHPVHWKGHNYKPLLVKKRGVDIVQVRGGRRGGEGRDCERKCFGSCSSVHALVFVRAFVRGACMREGGDWLG
jgi:hypothetical protein